MDNQMAILSSRNLIGQTIKELPLEEEYFFKRPFKKMSFYTDHPIELIPDLPENFPRDVEFIIKIIDEKSFRISTKSGSSFQLKANGSFGESIECQGIRFRVNVLNKRWIIENRNRSIFFIWHSHVKLVNHYRDKIAVEPASKKGTVVRIYLDGTNKEMNTDFLNKYLDNFLEMSLEKKNTKALRTISFIDEQLVGISDSLIITEENLQQFRSRNRIMDLSAQGQSIIDQAVALEREQAQRKIEADYYDYLSEYLGNNDTSAVLIAPATIDITDPGLTALVETLANLQAQYYSTGLGEKNPMQINLAQRIRNTKEALSETLNGVIIANNLALDDIRKQIQSLNARAAALPVTERQLLGIERKYDLKNELYTYLMEKRAQAQIQKASNVSDNEIIDFPEADSIPIKPRVPVNYMIALFAGLGLPFLMVIVYDALNLKVKDISEIQGNSDVPISGYIPHNSQSENLILSDDLNIPNTEAFRSLRTKIQFFTKEVKSPVILVTSSMSGEGKTSVSTNLAFVYSLLQENTLLVDFDLRVGEIHSIFDLENDTGISTWLIGKDKLEDVIKKTKYSNLDVLPSGPVPPNPAELASFSKTRDLLKILKKRYDYIVIDTPPIGLFSEAFHIASISDANLLVVRQNRTIKDSLSNTLNDIRNSEIDSISIVFNDLAVNQYNYRYSRRYMYKYYKEKRNGILKKSTA
jgi:capsular exopolysaccharide synthesis family protein